jgi:heme-degrading monooxygenase HmoA
MHARLTTTVVGDEPGSIAPIFEHIVPAIRELEGYRGLLVLSDLDEARFLVVTLWETAEAMDASQDVAAGIAAAETAQREFEIESMRHYRVDVFDVTR